MEFPALLDDPGEVMKGIDPGHLAGMDQAHEQIPRIGREDQVSCIMNISGCITFLVTLYCSNENYSKEQAPTLLGEGRK